MVSLGDLEYTTKTLGWTNTLLPYWNRIVERQQRNLRTEERKLREGKDHQVSYHLGRLDGIKEAVNAPESIVKGLRLRNGLKKIPSLEG